MGKIKNKLRVNEKIYVQVAGSKDHIIARMLNKILGDILEKENTGERKKKIKEWLQEEGTI